MVFTKMFVSVLILLFYLRFSCICDRPNAEEAKCTLLWSHDESLLTAFGQDFFCISGLERRINCQIAALCIRKYSPKKMKWEWMLQGLWGNWRWGMRRFKKGGKRKKKGFINRRVRNKNSNNRCEWWSDFQILFFSYWGCLLLWLAELAYWPLHSAEKC